MRESKKTKKIGRLQRQRIKEWNCRLSKGMQLKAYRKLK